MMTAAVYNVVRGSNSPALTPFDIFPDLKRAPAAQPARDPQSLDEQIAVLTAVMGCGPNPSQNG
jgi:hypothetical protein